MSEPFAGLDWASRVHAVCVIDEQANVLARFEAAHDGEGLAAMRGRLRALGVRRIAIERPNGLIVDFLLEAGFVVVPIHPNVVKATRPRYRSHGGKSDASDAFLLADLLRTDGHRFTPLVCQSDDIRALRALVRGRDELVRTRVQLANQLRTLLESFWPGAAAIFADVDSAIGLAFIQRYPSPESARRLGIKRLAAFCVQHGYSGRRPPAELLERLRQAPSITLDKLELEAKSELTSSLVRVLTTVVEQIHLLTRHIERDVGSTDDGRIFMSFPRAGRVCAAQILAEIGGQRDQEVDDAHQCLAAEEAAERTRHRGLQQPRVVRIGGRDEAEQEGHDLVAVDDHVDRQEEDDQHRAQGTEAGDRDLLERRDAGWEARGAGSRRTGCA